MSDVFLMLFIIVTVMGVILSICFYVQTKALKQYVAKAQQNEKLAEDAITELRTLEMEPPIEIEKYTVLQPFQLADVEYMSKLYEIGSSKEFRYFMKTIEEDALRQLFSGVENLSEKAMYAAGIRRVSDRFDQVAQIYTSMAAKDNGTKEI